MDSGSKVQKFERLIKLALDNGATAAKSIDTTGIVIDPRVRLKCEIPLCSGYNAFLTCPPYVMRVEEFEKIVKMYRYAIILQVETNINSLPKSDKNIKTISKGEFKNIYSQHDKFKKILHNLVNLVEAEAFKSGYYLATGLTGGRCALCDECVISQGKMVCKHPNSARPPMEAVGIDVNRTCDNAGLRVSLSSSENVKWTGIVLLE